MRYAAREVCSISGLTYRQLNHAVRTGRVPVADRAPGTGKTRAYDDDSLAAAVKLGKLRRDLSAPPPKLSQATYDRVAAILLEAAERSETEGATA